MGDCLIGWDSIVRNIIVKLLLALIAFGYLVRHSGVNDYNILLSNIPREFAANLHTTKLQTLHSEWYQVETSRQVLAYISFKS